MRGTVIQFYCKYEDIYIVIYCGNLWSSLCGKYNYKIKFIYNVLYLFLM